MTSNPLRRSPALWWWLGGLAALCLAACVVTLGTPSLAQLQQAQRQLADAYGRQPALVSATYFAVFTLLTAVCLPGCGLLMLLGGATFGLAWGTTLSVVASTVGATATMLGARYALRPLVREQLGERLAPFAATVARDGGYYLLSLRLLPVIPFVPVNLMAGVTELRVSTFFWVSLVGMLPGTAIYVHAGRQLAQIDSLGNLGSPDVVVALALLAALPLATRWGMRQNRAAPPMREPSD